MHEHHHAPRASSLEKCFSDPNTALIAKSFPFNELFVFNACAGPLALVDCDAIEGIRHQCASISQKLISETHWSSVLVHHLHSSDPFWAQAPLYSVPCCIFSCDSLRSNQNINALVERNLNHCVTHAQRGDLMNRSMQSSHMLTFFLIRCSRQSHHTCYSPSRSRDIPASTLILIQVHSAITSLSSAHNYARIASAKSPSYPPKY